MVFEKQIYISKNEIFNKGTCKKMKYVILLKK